MNSAWRKIFQNIKFIQHNTRLLAQGWESVTCVKCPHVPVSSMFSLLNTLLCQESPEGQSSGRGEDRTLGKPEKQKQEEELPSGYHGHSKS